MQPTKTNLIATVLGILCLIVVMASCGGVPQDELGEGFVDDEGALVDSEARPLTSPSKTTAPLPVKISRCPAGFTYYPLTNRCLADPSCSAPFSWNPTLKRCEAPPDCSPSYAWNATLKQCEALPVCTAPYTWNATLKQCEALPVCTAPFTWSSTLKRCDTPMYSDGSCPAGTDVVDHVSDLCIEKPGCPESAGDNDLIKFCGALGQAERCVEKAGCPAVNEGSSIVHFMGPVGQVVRCVEKPSCPEGTDMTIVGVLGQAELCVQNWTCPEGTDVINYTSYKCEADPLYPSFSLPL